MHGLDVVHANPAFRGRETALRADFVCGHGLLRQVGYGQRMPRALVTGATAGIGAAFARRLAADGFDLVAVARDEARLQQLADEQQRLTGRRVEVLAADLSTDDGCERVEARLREGGIDLLVNNAGFGANGALHEIDMAVEEAMLRVNVRAVMRLCAAVLPSMVAAGAGGIVNVSSFAGFVPSAGAATYAAGKAYVTALSEGLAVQYGRFGVKVTAVCPGFTHTEFHARSGSDMQGIPERLWLSPEQVVDAALADLHRGRPVSIPGGVYKGLASMTRVLPRTALLAAGRRAGSRRGRP